MIAYQHVIDKFREQGLNVRELGTGKASAQAPGHSPADLSITITDNGFDRVLVHSHAGEDLADVLSAVGLSTTDLFNDPGGSTYEYPDGRQVHRSPAKRFRQSGNTRGSKLYRAELDADVVYLVEGENDVHALETLGVAATCTAMGAGKAHLADLSPLHGKTVVVVRDKDEAGRRHADQIVGLLDGVATVALVEAKAGKDAADHVAAGFGVDEFVPVDLAAGPPVSSPTSPPGGRSLRLIPFTDEKDDVPVWAWEYDGKGRIPLGALALFAGRPGAGKSTSGRWIAASASTGTLAGQWEGKPVNVAYIAAEESAKYVVKPGLRASGADMHRVFMPKVELDGEEVRFLSSHDMAELTALLIENQVKLVVVDPLMSTIGSKTDINRNNEVRSLVEPWAKLAENIDGVVLGIAHLNKSSNGDVVAGINGSSAFGEVARSVFGFAKDPESDAGDRIMSQEKNSIGEEDLALTYRIESQDVVTDSGKTAEVGRFVIVGNSDRSVGDVLRDASRPNSDGGQAVQRTEAESWLGEWLADGSEHDSAEIKRAAKDAEIKERTLYRAVEALGVVKRMRGRPPKGFWSLPKIATAGEVTPYTLNPGKDGEDGKDRDELHKQNGKVQPDLKFAISATPTSLGDSCPVCGGPIRSTGKCVQCIVTRVS